MFVILPQKRWFVKNFLVPVYEYNSRLLKIYLSEIIQIRCEFESRLLEYIVLVIK